ncbi:acyl carrier protein [Accumulibacter sp.]|uniref:acyl carrier protein n=1 Tax=Accumulibacter sp. TaxID=2053492 RepID=UPI0028C3FAB9|nr:acyl carrier protein [Accumulibacter sp.]
MDVNAKQKLREFLKETLAKLADHKEFSDSESLFISGRLDSFSMMNLIMHLEESCGIDFSDLDFDVGLVDSVDDIEALVDSKT